MIRRCGRWVEGGGLAIALLLPLAFNPWAALPFEPVKVGLFQVVAGASLALAGACGLATGLRKARRPPELPGQSGEDRTPEAGGGWQSIRSGLWGSPAGPALLYGLGLIAAAAFSLDPQRSWWGAPDRGHGAFTLVLAVAFSLTLARVLDSRQRVDRLLLAIVLGSAPVVAYGLAQAAGLDPLAWLTDATSPVLSTMGRSNFLGAYLAVIMPLTAAQALVQPQRRGWGYAALLALQAICLLLTLARAAVLALLAGSVVLLGLLAWRWRSIRLAAALSIVLAGGALWLAITQTQTPLPAASLADQPAAPAFAELRTASAAARSVIWQATLRLIPDRWLLGYGPEMFAVVFMAHYPPALAQYQGTGVVVDDAHNLLLNELMTVGVVGLLALLGVVFGFYAVTWRAWRRAAERSWQITLAALLAAMTAWLVQAQFNPQVIVLIALFWLLVAVAGATSRLAPAAIG